MSGHHGAWFSAPVTVLGLAQCMMMLTGPVYVLYVKPISDHFVVVLSNNFVPASYLESLI